MLGQIVLPWYWRWVAGAVIAAALYGLGWIRGDAHGGAKVPELIAKQVTETARIAQARTIVTTKVETKYLPAITKTAVVTETILKEVPVYVPADAPACSGAFRVFHDAAAEGRLPDPARIPDAAPVPAQDATATVAENYGQCRADQLKLKGLQEWITEQLKVR